MSHVDEIKKSIFNNLDTQGAIDFLKESIKTPSVTLDEKKFGELLYEKMKKIGFDKLEMTEFKKDRPNIYGLANGTGEGSDLMFAGHIDTVPVTGWKEHWQGTDREDPFSAVTLKDEIWGRGAADMKAGVVAPLFALKAIKDSNIKLKGNVINVMVGDEEGDVPDSGYSDGIKAIVKKIKKGELPGADFAIYNEPTNLDVYTSQIGCIAAEVLVKGKSAYFGTPWLGVDAIKATHKLMDLFYQYSDQIWNKKNHPFLGRPVNLITKINGGNCLAVAGECKITMIRKVIPDETIDEVVEELENVLKIAALNHNIESEIKYTVPKDHKYGCRAAEISSDLEPVKILTNAVKEITGKKEIIKGAPYYSEGAFLIHDLGIPSVYCAAGDIANCHTFNERVNVEEFINSIKVFIIMILEYCGFE